MKTCGDFGGLGGSGQPCQRAAGWGRPGVSEGPCRDHTEEPRPLTEREARFVQEYFLDRNGAAAARRAGYSHRRAAVTAHELLHRPEVQLAIEAKRAELRERIGIQQERVIEELSRIAFANLPDVLDWGPKGLKLKSSRNLPPDVAAAVAEVRETQYGIGVKLHSKTDALGKLMDYLGMVVSRELRFDFDYSSLPEEYLVRITNGEQPIPVILEYLQEAASRAERGEPFAVENMDSED